MHGKRRHLTDSMGVRPHIYTVSNKVAPEINTVHSFGAQGNEVVISPIRSRRRRRKR
jgi:hypothetical protein